MALSWPLQRTCYDVSYLNVVSLNDVQTVLKEAGSKDHSKELKNFMSNTEGGTKNHGLFNNGIAIRFCNISCDLIGSKTMMARERI